MADRYNKYLRLGQSIKNYPMFKSDLRHQINRIEKLGNSPSHFNPRLGWRFPEIVARLNG